MTCLLQISVDHAISLDVSNLLIINGKNRSIPLYLAVQL